MPARQYFIRGKLVTVEEIPGVAAVKLELSDDADSAAREREDALRALGGEAPVEIPPTEREAFTRTGWVFVPPPAPESLDRPGGVPASHVGPVFREPNGHILIGTDRLTVKLNPGLSSDEARALLRRQGLRVVRELRFATNAYEIRVPSGDFLDLAVELQQRRDEYEYAEPEMIEHMGRRWKPKGREYWRQWHWKNDGSAGGVAGADVDAELAWDVKRGQGARIAVIDNGFDVKHPDLKAAIGAGSAYFRQQGANADFVTGLNGFPDDDHGTFCAGMAAARGNNASGGCGMANQAELMLIACLDDAIGTQATLARAVAYAADPTTEDATANSQDGAWVISCSVGPNNGVWTLQSVLENALEFVVKSRGGLGVPMFWAVANNNVRLGTDEVCTDPRTIAVGRSNFADKEGGSAFGPELDFLAPGVWVFNTTSASSGRLYDYATGTSFAAPCAAGIAALVLQVQRGLSWQDVRQIMRDSCDKIGGSNVQYGPNGHNDRYGYGRVNAAKAINVASGFLVGASSPVPVWP